MNREKESIHEAPVVIFVCEHGAAKSVIAATYFNQLANERGLNLRAVARGTNPDPEFSPKTIAGLQREGLTPLESVPQKLTHPEVESAQQIIAFSELREEYLDGASYEIWEDIPPVSESYEEARDAIIERLNDLLDSIRSSS